MKFNRFEDLEVWQLSRILVSNIYKTTQKKEFSRDFDLVSQIKRASVSIMLNISEGFERKSNKEFVNFLNYSKGSCGEVRAALYISLDLQYITQQEFDVLTNNCITISKSLSGFISYLDKSK